MGADYGVQSLSDPGRLPAEIALWQSAVPNSRLSIGFGAIYAVSSPAAMDRLEAAAF